MRPVSLIVSVLAFTSQVIHVKGRGGSFPQTENVGLHKPISTNGKKTCGSNPQQSSYCMPVSESSQLANGACKRMPCNLECPGRDREVYGLLPMINVTDGNLSSCITPDYTDNRDTGMPAFGFFNHPACFAEPREVLKTGTSPSQFTLAVWIKQARRNAGVIVEKIAQPRPGYQRKIVFSIMAGAYSVVMQYRGIDGETHFKALQTPIPPGEWHHLAIQVYNLSVSVFVDGIQSDGTPVLTDYLPIQIDDINYSPLIRIGQRIQERNDLTQLDTLLEEQYGKETNTSGQFVGLLQDYRWYETALTNRKIQEIYSGQVTTLSVQSNCLCPTGYPRVHPIHERYCIQNGVPDTTENRRLRLNENTHPLGYINDGEYNTTWVSINFYMRGGITFTFDLENEYEIFNVIIRFWNLQPQAITIARSSNRTTGGVMKTWGYFADDCMDKFGLIDNDQLETADSYNCITFPDKEYIPIQNNNITFSLLSDEPFLRPGKDDFYNNPTLMDFVTAERVSLRMQYQYFTVRSDVDVGHQIYAIREIEIIGRCNCNGHADACDMESVPYQCKCIPSSNTGGNMCEQCLPLFNNKPFRRGTDVEAFDCQPCECNGHADSCHYDITLDNFSTDFYEGGGGRCDNCKHHTAGVNCEMCAGFYFRKKDVPLNDANVCSSCACHSSGVINGTLDCEKLGGQCKCKKNVQGRTCSECKPGFKNLRYSNEEGCEECEKRNKNNGQITGNSSLLQILWILKSTYDYVQCTYAD